MLEEMHPSHPITRWITGVAKVVMGGAVPEGSTQALFGLICGVFMRISD